MRSIDSFWREAVTGEGLAIVIADSRVFGGGGFQENFRCWNGRENLRPEGDGGFLTFASVEGCKSDRPGIALGSKGILGRAIAHAREPKPHPAVRCAASPSRPADPPAHR